MDALSVLKDTPIPTLFVLGGIALLILSIVSQIGGKLRIARKRQNISVALGIVLLLFGVALYLLPTNESKPDEIDTLYPSMIPIWYYYVNVDEANVYEEASETSRKFETVTHCTQVEVMPGGYDPDWLHITYIKGSRRITGYVLTRQFDSIPCESTGTPNP